VDCYVRVTLTLCWKRVITDMLRHEQRRHADSRCHFLQHLLHLHACDGMCIVLLHSHGAGLRGATELTICCTQCLQINSISNAPEQRQCTVSELAEPTRRPFSPICGAALCPSTAPSRVGPTAPPQNGRQNEEDILGTLLKVLYLKLRSSLRGDFAHVVRSPPAHHFECMPWHESRPDCRVNLQFVMR
jgi:hypothetical protein